MGCKSMSNVEIYDSSNSQLSSDEYSNDEDDDALMDVAVSKQQTSTKSDPKSTESSSSAKADSATTTPRKLSDDMDAIAGGSTKPPASREVTQRQIKQLQRNNQANLYFKQRSIKWLQRLSKKTNCSAELKAVLPAREAHAKRMIKRRTKKNMRLLAEIVRRSERTPSRSRTHSGSASGSEVVCLDDTENEDSPDKVTETAAAARHFAQSVQDLVVKNANAPFNLKLELGAEATAVAAAAAAAAAENNILDEFLTMKPIKAAEPIVQQDIVINDIKKQPTEEQLPFQLIVEPAACNLQMPVEEVTNKRRRSISPPTVEPNSEKRTKPIVTDDFDDDDIIEFLPVKQPTPPTAAPITTTPMHKAAAATFKPNIETPNTPAFKLGSPYTLTPSSGMGFYAQKKPQSQQQQQPAVSYSLDTPTPPVEPMEIVYPTAKTTLPQRESLKTANEAITFATPHPVQPQQQQQYQQPQPSVDWQKPRPKKIIGQTPAVAAPAVGASAATATATPQTRNKSNPTELNNSNSNATFHQRIKETYPEFDEVMTDKVNNITPELLALRQEEIKNNADIDTLNNLLSQKEEEWNRLEHLLCVKKELGKRIERKTRILVINEVLPSILNRSCSTAELHNFEALMYKEKNAPMPLRFGSTAIEKLIENVANDQDDIGLLMGFLGVPDRYKAYLETPKSKPPPPQSHYASQLHRRNSVPAMRPTMPPPAVERRHNDYHWDHHHAEREVESQPTRRSKPQPPHSNYQQLINESKELINSTTDLSASSSYRSRQQQQQPPPHPTLDTQRKHTNSMDNHLDNETSPKPLYNSSPLGSSKSINQRNDIHPQFNDLHSNYRSGDQYVRRSNNHNTNRINRFARSNGPQELDPDCHHCGRPNADLLCVNCKNIWYCSRECQLRAWDVEHWQSCTN